MRTQRISRIATVAAAALVLAGGAFLAGCDDHVQVDRDKSIPIQKGQTWAWRPGPVKGSGPAVAARSGRGDRPNSAYRAREDADNPVISRDTLMTRETQDTQAVRDRLKLAFQNTLASKGLVQADDPASATFLVDYHVGIQKRQETVARPVYPPVVCGYYGCWSGWGYWGPTPVVYQRVRFHEGTMVFSLTKANDNRVAFRATSQKVVTRESYSPDELNSAVQHLLKELKPAK